MVDPRIDWEAYFNDPQIKVTIEYLREKGLSLSAACQLLELNGLRSMMNESIGTMEQMNNNLILLLEALGQEPDLGKETPETWKENHQDLYGDDENE